MCRIDVPSVDVSTIRLDELKLSGGRGEKREKVSSQPFDELSSICSR